MLASGAHEKPLVFPGNDRPGIMLATSARLYLRRHGIVPGQRIVIATAGDDPLLVAWDYGQGRAVAFASDCGPHWAPPQFVEWDGYARLWSQIARWVAGD